VKVNKPIAFVVLAFVIGATISQGSFAFADDSSTNPFRAIWEAIGELQTKTDSLQAQIDDIKTQQQQEGASPSAAGQAVTKNSETSLSIDLSGGQPGQTLISLVARNAGPDSAVGVKLSTYYQMSLFRVNHIDGAQCTDQARGIIECYLGTIESGGEARITIDATTLQIGQQAIITADASSITKDVNPGNNHAETVFVTASQAAPQVVEIPPSQQQQQPTVEQPAQSIGEQQEQQQQPVQNQTSTQQENQSEQPAAEQQPNGQSSSGEQQNPGEQTSQPGSEQQNSGSEGASGSSGDSSNPSSSDNNSTAGSDSGSSDSSSTSSPGSSSSDTGSSDAGSGSSGDSGSTGDSSSGDSSSGEGSSSSGSSSDSGTTTG
jgi:outer membrane biosynthesis protein TonB